MQNKEDLEETLQELSNDLEQLKSKIYGLEVEDVNLMEEWGEDLINLSDDIESTLTALDSIEYARNKRY